MSWRNETTPVPKETDPGAVFDRLFGGLTKAEMVKSKDIRKKFRKSVLDFAVDDAKRLQGQLGQLDRQKLDEYLDAVRDVEKRLVGSEKLMLNEGGVPDYPRPAGVPSSLTEHAKLMLDMLTLSFQTDSTRIASFMMFNEGSNRGYPDLDVPEGHHDLSHHGKSEEKQRKIAIIDRYHVTMFAHLLSRIAVVPEGEGKLLDNCLIVYGSGISDGVKRIIFTHKCLLPMQNWWIVLF